jgi:hypothetical protein
VASYRHDDYMKVEFPDEGIGEWMLVRVDRCDDALRVIYGILDNEPVKDYGGKVKLGSELAVSFDKIREHRKGSESRLH